MNLTVSQSLEYIFYSVIWNSFNSIQNLCFEIESHFTKFFYKKRFKNLICAKLVPYANFTELLRVFNTWILKIMLWNLTKP